MFVFAVFSSVGCMTGKFHASSLPADLQAPPMENAQTLDLSRLGSFASNSDIIERGDVLEVTISAGLTNRDVVTRPVRVNENGMGVLPYLGEVSLAKLDFEGAEATIATQCVNLGLYREPHVTVTMKQQRMNRVTVLGGVKKPGILEIPRGNSDLLAAITAAGGLSEHAGTDVEIRYPGGQTGSPPAPVAGMQPNGVSSVGHSFGRSGSTQPKLIKVNLAKAVTQGTNGYSVDDGAIITIERRAPKPVYVTGLVKRPGRYEFPVGEELSVLGAISLAYGTSSNVADKVYVIRELPHSTEPSVIVVSLQEAKTKGEANLRLAPGDIVSVELTTATVLLDVLKVIRFGIGASLTSFL